MSLLTALKHAASYPSYMVACLCSFITGLFISKGDYGFAILIGIVGLVCVWIWLCELTEEERLEDMKDMEGEE